MRIEHGALVAIVGPSGSGKSTLLGLIAGLDTPTSGRVLVDGVNITRMSEVKLAAVRNQKIGMAFEAFNLIPTLTVEENVEVPLYVGKHPRRPSERAKAMLTLVGMGHRLTNKPNQLSGGEQQRVAVALALLERRRELGILKAVGFTSITVVGEVLVENAVVGIIAGMLADLCICVVVPELGTQLFGQPFTVSPVLAIAILLGAAALSMVVAAAVAWHPTRIRPLEVLRYE